MPKTAKSANGGKRHPLNMRTTKETRDRLERAAAASGRSLAQEVEVRLEQSFRNEGLLNDVLELAYGKPIAGLLKMIGDAIKEAGPSAGFSKERTLDAAYNWWTVPYAYQQVEQATARILEAGRPEGEPTPPSVAVKKTVGACPEGWSISEVWENYGTAFGEARVAAVAGKGATAEHKKVGKEYIELLGPLAERVAQKRG